MISVQRFDNQLMNSSCYVLFDESARTCIVIDPGSEKCEKIRDFLEYRNLKPVYIILTHEHTDHTWGCNYLRENYTLQLICSKSCYKYLNATSRSYFLFYYDNKGYEYIIKKPDLFIEDLDFALNWNSHELFFIETPGHSKGSICISIEDMLFTGDTLMNSKPVISKHGGNKNDYNHSLTYIFSSFSSQTMIFPGHGYPFYLKDIKYTDYIV